MTDTEFLNEGFVAEAETPPSTTRPLAIEVRDLHKSYRIPISKVSTLKERAVSLFKPPDYRELRALNGISFHVEQGEFFGIVGRNGSGKSTLLKLLASIYRADSGRIRMAGRLAPFIELGVGFNPELTAHENVAINGVMMGLTPREAQARFDSVLEFAELGEFTELKLKNYSSGMLVRLAFSLMVQVDADVLMVDEVLAVGDAAFQLKCMEAFARLHDLGKTIVLVTHDTSVVERNCDRALLIEGGKIDTIGDPGEVARRYLEINFEHRDTGLGAEDAVVNPAALSIEWEEVWLQGTDGERARNVEQGEPIEIHARFRALRDVETPGYALQIVNYEGVLIGGPTGVELGDEPLVEGESAYVVTRIDNRLAPGHYFVHTLVGAMEEHRMVAFRKHALDFVVFGTKVVVGMVELDIESSYERGDHQTDGRPPG
jgi:ABC-type polysaccharide/polyol phosphate transport system ATPase subunit